MSSNEKNSFGTRTELKAGGKSFQYHSLPAYEKKTGKSLARLPYSIKILLENLLRYEDDVTVRPADIEAVVGWNPKAEPDKEIQFRPSRIILQDFTGVPAVCDLAAMRAAIKKLGGNPARINPLQPADLVVDHSIQVDFYGTSDAKAKNTQIEFERNRERYEFLRWGQTAFKNFRVVPPDTGIVHQVNLEYLARVAWTGKRIGDENGPDWVYPDSLIGTDSHTTMINGLGVLGWGVGGIEAEAAMLGQPVTMLIPQVVGMRLTGKLPAGTTATDLVLTVTQVLRAAGVVGKFVEFFGPGMTELSLADRATLANMAPEYGATIGIFPVDPATTGYLKLTGRDEAAALTEAYYKAQGLWFEPTSPEAEYSEVIGLDLASIEPSLAGPSRPQDRVALQSVAEGFQKALPGLFPKGAAAPDLKKKVPVKAPSGPSFELGHGSVVIAAITSCTNTSNPSVLMAAGLVAKKAVERGLTTKPWVKTSLAPGSKVVTNYLQESGLLPSLEKLGFHVVGYGCTTCIGNSGPLPDHIINGIGDGQLVVSSVLSGNRNFEGRVSPQVRANYLASPPLVVAYALAGDIGIDISKDPVGNDKDGKPVFLKDIWPSPKEVADAVSKFVTSGQFKSSYSDVFTGGADWQAIRPQASEIYQWDAKSTYIKQPPFFEGMTLEPLPAKDIQGARVLAFLGDSVTTDHISPAGSIQEKGPAGLYLVSLGVTKKDFNSFGARRGNHEIMIRGTFGNTRLKNLLVPGVEGPYTKLDGKETTIYEASTHYQSKGVPLVVLAGKEYGTGSSRDWAAKGTALLGIKAVIAESFERIHRSNLVGMGVLPLQYKKGESAASLGLKGDETFDIAGLGTLSPGKTLSVKATGSDGQAREFEVRCRIDTPNELEYFRHGGILHFVLRQALKK